MVTHIRNCWELARSFLNKLVSAYPPALCPGGSSSLAGAQRVERRGQAGFQPLHPLGTLGLEGGESQSGPDPIV